jgi:hypothetical protein
MNDGLTSQPGQGEKGVDSGHEKVASGHDGPVSGRVQSQLSDIPPTIESSPFRSGESIVGLTQEVMI